MSIQTIFFAGAPANPAELLDREWQLAQPHHECGGVTEGELWQWQDLIAAAMPACHGAGDAFVPVDRADLHCDFNGGVYRFADRISRAIASLNDAALEKLVQTWHDAQVVDHARQHRTGWLAQHRPCDASCLTIHVGPIDWRRALFQALRAMARGLPAAGSAADKAPALYMYYNL